MTAPLLRAGSALDRRVRGTPFLVMLDVDGTLAPIAPTPDAAEVPLETQRAVAQLAARDGVHVVLVSGRAATDARRLVRATNVWVIGNHGGEVIAPDGDSTVDARVAPYRAAMAQVARRLRTKAAHVPGVIVEDKTWTLSIHYRLASPAVVPGLRAAIEEAIRDAGLRVTDGKMVFEVRPPVEVHKGTAVVALASRLGGLMPGASVLYAGDDRTDEDAFASLRAHAPNAVTIRVGVPEGATTAAEFVVADTVELCELLKALADLRPR